MLVERSMDPRWLSNAYLLADEEGGAAVYVDSGAPLEPLLEAAERWNVQPEYVLRTHGHQDHVVHEPTLGLTVVTRGLDAGGLHIEALPTPGHADDHLAFVVNGELCFSGDILFKDAVGGGSDVPAIRSSVMQLMELAPETRVLPGHTDETTIGREWEENPFVRFWRGIEPGGEGRGRVGIEDVTILVDSPDYDGKGKLLVRFDDGREAILGGSRVER
jgi:glyoxylase-like metal-dependent hydrolase (beta-lactamase superfamily II)